MYLSSPKTFENHLVFPDTTYELTLSYIGMGCTCPQWATPEDLLLFEQSLGNEGIPMDSLFVTLAILGTEVNPFALSMDTTTYVFTGRMSTNKFKWQGEDGSIWSNRVFEYEKVRTP